MIELRLGWNYEVGGAGSEVSGAESGEALFAGTGHLIREHSLNYGVKLKLTDQSQWIPRSVFILTGTTPTGGSAEASTATQFIGTYACGWELPNRWRFDSALRYGTASEAGDRFSNWAPSAVLRIPIGERWAIHGEYFGGFTSGLEANSTKHYFSPGVHWLMTPYLEVGVRLGWGLNEQASQFFSNVGLGWRF